MFAVALDELIIYQPRIEEREKVSFRYLGVGTFKTQ